MNVILERKLPKPPPDIDEVERRVKEFWERKWLKKLNGRELVRNHA